MIQFLEKNRLLEDDNRVFCASIKYPKLAVKIFKGL